MRRRDLPNGGKEFAVDSRPIGQGFNSQQEVLSPNAGRSTKPHGSCEPPRVSTIHLSRSSRIPTEPCSAIGAPRSDRSNSRRHDYVVPLGGHADQATLVNGRNGELRNDHPYVSDVLVVHDLGDGAYRSDAYITNSSNAAPLPSALFAGPKDAFYDYEASLDAYVPRAQGANHAQSRSALSERSQLPHSIVLRRKHLVIRRRRSYHSPASATGHSQPTGSSRPAPAEPDAPFHRGS